jgi:carbamoyl-phosphate synthase large subunit
MSFGDKITVLVSGVSQNSVGHQIAKSLFMYRDLYRIIGTNVDISASNSYHIDAYKILPHSSNPNYIKSLVELCKECGVKAILPGSEDELMLISKNSHIFELNGIKPITLDYGVIDLCLNKNKLIKALSNLNIPQPFSIPINSKNDLDSIELFPLVLKPARGSGSKGVIIIQNKKELDSLVPIWLENYGKLICQEYIDSTSGEYTVGVITDPLDGLVRNSIIMKRLITNGIGHGSKISNKFTESVKEPYLVLSSGISQGIFIKDKNISDQIEDSISKLGIKGVVNVQCRIKDGVVKIFEINPRFSGTTFGRALCGYNEPHLLLQRIINEIPIQPRFPYQLGTYERRIQDIFTVI